MYKRQKQHLLNLFAASHREKKSEKSSTYDGQTLLCLHFDWSRHPSCVVQLNVNRVFSHDVTVAILVSQNNETAAMLVSQTNPLGVELFSYANAFFCSNKFA